MWCVATLEFVPFETIFCHEKKSPRSLNLPRLDLKRQSTPSSDLGRTIHRYREHHPDPAWKQCQGPMRNGRWMLGGIYWWTARNVEESVNALLVGVYLMLLRSLSCSHTDILFARVLCSFAAENFGKLICRNSGQWWVTLNPKDCAITPTSKSFPLTHVC